jgi:opacity protein-like surface antigen
MKAWFIGLALASTALATPAAAREGAVYLEFDGGVMKLQDIDFDIGTVDDAVRVDTDDYGYDFGGIVGYDFGGFRLEGEVGYRGIEQDELTSTVRIPTVGTNPLIGSIGNVDAAGDVKALSFMANAMGDFGDDDGLQFFVGAGAGYAKVDFDASVDASGPGFIDDDDWGFAWQLLAGIRAPVSDTIDAGIKYRYFNVGNLDFDDAFGRSVDGDWSSHSLLGTITFNFGGSEPMPEPVAAPPPPAPEPAPVYTPPPPPPAPEPMPRPAERG